MSPILPARDNTIQEQPPLRPA